MAMVMARGLRGPTALMIAQGRATTIVEMAEEITMEVCSLKGKLRNSRITFTLLEMQDQLTDTSRLLRRLLNIVRRLWSMAMIFM
jgi:hypothetical protein